MPGLGPTGGCGGGCRRRGGGIWIARGGQKEAGRGEDGGHVGPEAATCTGMRRGGRAGGGAPSGAPQAVPESNATNRPPIARHRAPAWPARPRGFHRRTLHATGKRQIFFSAGRALQSWARTARRTTTPSPAAGKSGAKGHPRPEEAKRRGRRRPMQGLARRKESAGRSTRCPTLSTMRCQTRMMQGARLTATGPSPQDRGKG